MQGQYNQSRDSCNPQSAIALTLELLPCQSALVTGGDSGIGRAIVLHLAREGANIAISYLDEHQDAEEIKKVVEEAGVKALLLPGDLRSEEQCKYSCAPCCAATI